MKISELLKIKPELDIDLESTISDSKPLNESLKLKYVELKESDCSKKQLSLINKTFSIDALSFASVELLGFKPFRPLNLTILVKNYETNEELYCEINNITVMGDPQLINFSGVTDESKRGNSILFSKGFDISNRSVFGSSAGQGLTLDLYNSHESKIKVEIILTGWEIKSEHLGQVIFTNTNKILFSKIKCAKNSVTKQIVQSGRYSALKSNYLQINSFNHNDKSLANLEILDISVAKKSQIYSLEEDNSLSSNFFSSLKQVNFDVFGYSKSKELIITFKNTNDYDIENYITILGEHANDDLIGQK